MKLWVDDERPAPSKDWVAKKTSKNAIKTLTYFVQYAGRLEEVSLDHDLGGEDTGFKVLDWMIEHNVWPEELTIHTSNPPARARMVAAANASGPADMRISVITDHLRKD